MRMFEEHVESKDIEKDPFEEYIIQTEPSQKELGYAWYTAMGLQAVDGLQPSEYLQSLAIDNIEGKISLGEANRLIERYYEESSDRDIGREKEADIVSSRIAMVLSEKAFSFSVPQYIGIHERLFEGIYQFAGKLRDYNISKREWVLDGASVNYGNANELEELLEYDLKKEKVYDYSSLDKEDIIQHFAVFISDLWQIHAFGEGNTRTTAVFFIKYLRTLGFDVSNDLFAKNSWYFRNSLVRANYNNYTKDIHATTKYIELFLRNLLYGEKNVLKNRYMHIRWNDVEQDIRNEKQDIGIQKQDIKGAKQDIDLPSELTNKTKQHIINLNNAIGFDKCFGRTDVMTILNLTASPASALIKRMLTMELIVPVKGKGKGKYVFRKKS